MPPEVADLQTTEMGNTRGPAPYTIFDGFIYTVEDHTSTSRADGNVSNSSSTPLIAGLVGGPVSATLIAGIESSVMLLLGFVDQ
ncbi:hypothetical protein PLEOSDRAFT_152193 [Pleurotus ostreatus PC15]|uniref:Uncharacterized protein n=1 Tax=Pleurotus ostreatus (strain PC15) TaxID=1137138 RepID=A0A067P1I0_PLEO1|nr:hypothetical protein PLEOSDRAFT_152193 [Pleurotus ostreatus PC15]